MIAFTKREYDECRKQNAWTPCGIPSADLSLEKSVSFGQVFAFFLTNAEQLRSQPR